MRMFDDLDAAIEGVAIQLLQAHDELELKDQRINGYRVTPEVFAALESFLRGQANLVEESGKVAAAAYERRSELWYNFGGIKRDNASVKRFDVLLSADGALRMKASLVTIADGLSPFEELSGGLLCCGNHCSSGCYDACPGTNPYD